MYIHFLDPFSLDDAFLNKETWGFLDLRVLSPCFRQILRLVPTLCICCGFGLCILLINFTILIDVLFESVKF